MRTASIATGSIGDRINAVVIQLRGCADLPAVEYRWGKLVSALEDIGRRAGLVRARGGSTANLIGPLTWLDQVVREHPALAEPGGAGLRDELLRLIRRIRSAKG